MGRFFLWLSCLIFLGSFVCFADEPNVSFKFIKGEPVEVDYGDGRVAEWVMGRRPITQIHTKYQVTENTCTGREGIRGEFLLTFQSNAFELRWKKNPKSELINNTVKTRLKKGPAESSFIPLKDEFEFLTNDFKKTAPVLTKDFPEDAFTASDFSWLPGGGAEPPESIEFVRWDTEFMQPNPETGLNENRTITIAAHSKFVRSKEKLELKEFAGGASNPFGGRIILFVGDVWAVILRHGDDEFCQISIKANLSELQLEAAKYFMLQPTIEPYRFGTDEYSNTRMPIQFKNYVEKWKEYEVE